MINISNVKIEQADMEIISSTSLALGGYNFALPKFELNWIKHVPSSEVSYFTCFVMWFMGCFVYAHSVNDSFTVRMIIPFCLFI